MKTTTEELARLLDKYEWWDGSGIVMAQAAARLRALECDVKRLEEENRATAVRRLAERVRELEVESERLREALGVAICWINTGS